MASSSSFAARRASLAIAAGVSSGFTFLHFVKQRSDLRKKEEENEEGSSVVANVVVGGGGGEEQQSSCCSCTKSHPTKKDFFVLATSATAGVVPSTAMTAGGLPQLAIGSSSSSSSNNKKNNNSSSNSNSKNEKEEEEEEDEVLDDGYPTFSKYHRSLLKKYLTRDVWNRLKDRRTASGVTMEDIIRCGTSLPYGHDPPRGIGILAGDADSYRVFAPLFERVIREYHNFGPRESFNEGVNDADDSDGRVLRAARSTLRRHHTDINPHGIVTVDPDPMGSYILSTRIRVARSIEGYPFPPTMTRSDRRAVERLVRQSVQYLADNDPINHPGQGGGGLYLPLWSMTNSQIDDLFYRHVLFDRPDEWAIGAGLGRDWPDGRGVYINVKHIQDTPDVIVWVNEEDHVRVICLRKGGDIRGVFSTVSRAVRTMEGRLLDSGRRFVHDARLGYLTSCPTNIGTALRASVHVKLIRLGQQPGFHDMVRRMRLEARGYHGEGDRRYTGIFDVSNAERLGKSEVQLVNIMIGGVAKLIELEKKLENGETINCANYP